MLDELWCDQIPAGVGGGELAKHSEEEEKRS